MVINPLYKLTTTLRPLLSLLETRSPASLRSRLGPVLAGCLLLSTPHITASADDRVSHWYGEWMTLPAAEVGYDEARLQAAISRIGEMHGIQGLQIIRHGYLLAEQYWRGGARDVPHNLKSASKSVISALVGIAIEQGHFQLDQPIVELLPQLAGIGDPDKQRITVRHLLEMTSGLRSNSYQAYDVWVTTPDWVKSALSGPMQSAPGSRYDYNTANTHLLSAIIANTSGMSTRQFAEKHLFRRIGARVQEWPTDPDGIHIGGNNLWLLPRDMARFGQLFLDRGRWGKRSVIPPEWVDVSVRSTGRTTHDTYGGYGYLWWTPFDDGSFAAVGYGGQYIIVSPGDDSVIVITSTLDSKGDHWEKTLFDTIRDGIRASLDRPQLPLVAKTRTRLNLRAGPGLKHDSVSVVDAAEPVHWFASEGDWQRVRVQGRPGWLHGDYLDIEQPAPTATVTEAAPAAVEQPAPAVTGPSSPVRTDEVIPVAGSRLDQLREQLDVLQEKVNAAPPLPRYRIARTVNFRRSPSLQGELIGKLEPGIEFQAQERSEAWLMASIDGAQGWVHSGFADVIERPTLASQRAGLVDGLETVSAALESLTAVEELNGDDAALAQLLNEARAERDALQRQLDDSRQQLQQREAIYDEEVARLQKQTDDLAGIAAQVKSELEALLAEKAQQAQTLQALASEKEQVLMTLASERERMQSLIGEAAAQRAEKQQLRSELDLLGKLDQQREKLRETDRAQLATLEREVDQAVEQLRSFEQRVQELTREKAEQAEQIELAGLRQQDLVGQLRATALAESSLRGDVAQMQDENRRLEEALAELRSRSATMATGQQVLAGDLQQRLDELANARTENDRLTRALADAQARVQGLDEKLLDKQDIERDLHQRLANGQQNAARLESELGAAREEVTALQQAVEEQRLAGQEQTGTLTDLREQLAAAERQATTMQQEVDALRGRLTQQQATAGEQADALRTETQRATAVNARLEQSDAENARLTARLDRESAARQTLTDDLQQLLAQINLQQRQIFQLDTHNAQAQLALADREAALARLRSEQAQDAASLEEKASLLANANDKASRLEQRLGQQQLALETRTSELQALSAGHAALREELDTGRQRQAELQTAHDALLLKAQLAEADVQRQQVRIARDAERIATLERELKAAGDETDALHAAARETASAYSELGNALAMLWQQNRIALSANARLEKNLADGSRESAQQQSRLSGLQQTLDERDARLKALTGEMAQAAKAGDLLDQQRNELAQQLAKRDEQLAETRERLDAAVRAGTTLETRISQLEQINSEQTGQLTATRATADDSATALAAAQARLTQLQAASEQDASAASELSTALERSEEQLQAKSRELADVRQSMVQARDELSEELTLARSELQALQHSMPQLRAQLAESEKINTTLQAQADQRDAVITALRADIAQLGSENSAIGDELDKLIAGQARSLEIANAERDRLKAENARLADALETAGQRDRTNEQKLAGQSTRIAQLQKQMQSIDDELDAAGKRHAEVLTQLGADRDRLASENARLASSLELADERNQANEQKLAGQSAQMAALESTSLEQAESATELQQRLADMARAQQGLEQSLANKEQRNQQLMKQLAARSERDATMAVALEQAQTEISALRGQLDQQVATLQQARLAGDAERAELVTELEQLRSRSKDAGTLAKSRLADIEERDSRLAQSARQLQQEQSRTAALQAQITQLENQVAARDIEIAAFRTVERHLNATLAQVSDLQRAADARESDSKTMIAAVDRLQTAYDLRQQELADLRAGNAAQAEALRQARARTGELERRLAATTAPHPVAADGIQHVAVDEVAADTEPKVLLASAQPLPQLETEAAAGVAGKPRRNQPVHPLPTAPAAKPQLLKVASQGALQSPQAADALPATAAGTKAAATIEPLVRRWAAAWSRKDVEGYLSFYSDDFQPENGLDLDGWQAQRQVRISKPKSIQVEVSGFDVVAQDGDSAQVSFDQAYQANHYRDQVRKTLDLKREGETWKIVREIGS